MKKLVPDPPFKLIAGPERGIGMLSNASHSAETARALVEHALNRL